MSSKDLKRQLPDDLRGSWRNPETGTWQALRFVRDDRVMLRQVHEGKYRFSYVTIAELRGWDRVSS